MILIQAKELYKSYGSLEVLKGLSLDVLKGETLVILGQSGAGKSVLLRLIMGLDSPDSGLISIGGIYLNQTDESKRWDSPIAIGMLFQGGALFDSMTIEENVAFALSTRAGIKRNGKLKAQEVKERVDEALSLVGLSGTQKKMPSELSGGMRKRAALARLIVYRPQVLLYDEPTTGLDPITSMQISELIVKIQSELNATSIVVTHDIASALTVADRLAMHQGGKIAYVDKKEAFIDSDDAHIQSFLRTSNYQRNSSHES